MSGSNAGEDETITQQNEDTMNPKPLDLPDMTLEEAEKLWPGTDYAFEAANQDDNPINTGDATAFFLEGYLYARKLIHERTL